MTRPKLLMLDEPAGGLNHSEVDELAELMRRVREHLNLSILLVEHHMNLVMRVSDKVVALEFGVKIADGTPDEVRAEPEVIRAYLGDTQDACRRCLRPRACTPAYGETRSCTASTSWSTKAA